jgi:hypothetical protein
MSYSTLANDSILNTIKKLLGLGPEYTPFDTDVITNINTIFSNLAQMGVGSPAGFTISDEKAKWGDFLGSSTNLENLKTYIYTKTKIAFDPPQNSNLLESLNKIANEIEWRLYTEKGGY